MEIAFQASLPSLSNLLIQLNRSAFTVFLQLLLHCFFSAFTEFLLQLLLTFGKFKPPLHGLRYSTVLFTLSFLFCQRKLKSFSCTHFIIASGTLNIEAEYTILEMPNALTNKVLPIRVSSRHSPRFSFVSIFFYFAKEVLVVTFITVVQYIDSQCFSWFIGCAYCQRFGFVLFFWDPVQMALVTNY